MILAPLFVSPQVKRGSKQTWRYFAALTSFFLFSYLGKLLKWRRRRSRNFHSFSHSLSLRTAFGFPGEIFSDSYNAAPQWSACLPNKYR